MIAPNRLLAVLDSRIGWWTDGKVTHIVYECPLSCGCDGGWMLDDRDFEWRWFLAAVCAWHAEARR